MVLPHLFDNFITPINVFQKKTLKVNYNKVCPQIYGSNIIFSLLSNPEILKVVSGE